MSHSNTTVSSSVHSTTGSSSCKNDAVIDDDGNEGDKMKTKIDEVITLCVCYSALAK